MLAFLLLSLQDPAVTITVVEGDRPIFARVVLKNAGGSSSARPGTGR